ncbi:hypothetical protein CL616_03070 [archaeon]|nr:hypothetical protein [archaeon]|tara:strand:+ start:331 stop:1320 length:990 start_codon:yes stop_codon:yes gene_type:complete
MEKLKEVVEGKKVMLCCHWDADGVSSGGIIYHLIRDWVGSVITISKGKRFVIEKEDIDEDCDVVICVDIQPGDIFDKKVVYIDHHPADFLDKCDYVLHDEKRQSCSLLIYQDLLKDKSNPYFIFLSLLGYFGDQGKRDEIPKDLYVNAMNFIPDLMVKRNSYYSEGYYLEIEKYVSALNVGKRMHWKGDVPLELLKCIDCYKPFIYNTHPLAKQLQDYKKELRNHYEKDYEVNEVNGFDVVVLQCDNNIQGVIAARNMKGKPIIVINQKEGEMIGSMRVPDDMDFDAGKFLDSFNGKIESYIGGGHEKAGGFTVSLSDFNRWVEMLKEN